MYLAFVSRVQVCCVLDPDSGFVLWLPLTELTLAACDGALLDGTAALNRLINGHSVVLLFCPQVHV